VRNDRLVRVLFSTTPGEGHVRPLLPLARALRVRGHEVAFSTAAGWQPRLEELGFPVLPAGIDHHAARASVPFHELAEVPPREHRLFLFPRLFAGAHPPAKLPDLLERARDWRPDAIVHESADLAAPLAAALLRIPCVNHSFGAMVPLAVSARAGEVVAPLWRAHDLEPDPYAGAFRGLYVDIAPLSLRRESPPAPAVSLRPAERRSGEPCRVYATMGTVWNDPAHFRLLLEALAGRPALVTTGDGVDPASLGIVPDGVRVERFVPQEEVLPSATAVISHGGSGTMLGALAHGLPLVLLPQGADQFDNAERCVEAGVALALGREETDADAIRSALERVLGEPSFADAAQRIAAEIEAMPTADEVAQAVEEHVHAG
jgi:UDP:flavonoid glycosyltransferase YjiC (YdhE family)